MSDKGLELIVTCPCCTEAFDTVCFGQHTSDAERAVIEAVEAWVRADDLGKPMIKPDEDLRNAVTALQKARQG